MVGFILISSFQLIIYSQEEAFSLQNKADKRIIINSTFSSNTQIQPFTSVKPISGLAISSNITLNSDSSLVRITLLDEQHYEYLVCETYPLQSGSNSLSLKDFAEETANLNNIIPNALKIELVDATIYLKEIATSRKEKLMVRAKIDRLRQQNEEKINKINENIRRKGGKWMAGETSVSKLSYEEKKQLFGGRVPNLQGFEYYIGGIFVMPGTFEGETDRQSQTAQSPQANVTPYAEEFSWRNRHGQDWVTPVKSQRSCGSCWAFAVTGATELLVNLYYNQHLDLDLSEQDAISCSGAGTCNGGSPEKTSDYYSTEGVVDEDCFPYMASNLPCSDKCNNPAEIIKTGGKIDFMRDSEDALKALIISGPVSGGCSIWSHAMTLVGYKTIQEGDEIYLRSCNQNIWITIPANDPLIGKIAWQFKNSLSTYWGDMGYAYLVTEITNIYRTFLVLGPVTSLNLGDSDIACTDADGDGYYTWGIGAKPAHCPPCPDQPDGDDSDPCAGPMDEYGHIHFFTPSPVVQDITILEGETVPDLWAEGENVIWYSDKKKTTVLHTGNSFATGQSSLGIYTYYVTQTLAGCESDVTPVTLMIKIHVPPPDVESITIYPGESTPTLFAQGYNIKWYGDINNPLYDPWDRQSYATIKIGDQLWMAENLKTTKYNNGSRISLVTDSEEWNTNGPAYCWYNNDEATYKADYGALYNWYTVNPADNGKRNICPVGWQVPTDIEWRTLTTYLGGPDIAGGKLKETGTSHWKSPNTGADNSSGFTALPGGCRFYDGDFGNILYGGSWWSSTCKDNYNAYKLSLIRSDGQARHETCVKQYGQSLRCILNPSEPLASGNYYKPVYELPGTYIYYVTQTISGFESPADTVMFKILSEIPAPETENITVCENNQVPDLIAKGNDIKWYDDPQLTLLLNTGDTLTTGQISPGTYIYYVTQSFSGYESPPDTVVLTIRPIPEAPISHDLSVCEGETNQNLNATGENIKWYSDSTLTNLLYTGDIFSTGQTEPGIYRYFVTQTISDCESPAVPVLLTIKNLPAVPVAEDLFVCEGQPIPDLTAIGENLRWYSDSTLANLLHSGNSYTSDHTEPGTYTYYATQSIFSCESPGVPARLIIHPNPVIELGKDTVIRLNEKITFGPFIEDYNYFWSNGSDSPDIVIYGYDIGLGSHIISVVVTDSNVCQEYDTIRLTVINPSNITLSETNGSIKIYPNPNYGLFNIEFSELSDESILVKIINQNGEEIYNHRIYIEDTNRTLLLNVSFLPNGIYYVKFITKKKQYFGKLFLQ